MKGRKPLFESRMKSNGLPAELDDWYKKTAQEKGITCAALKRLALEKYWADYTDAKLMPEAVSTPDVVVLETVI